jgi:Tol biopolymer transport system component/DNA-binding winged helix-turn-helix (wHTH) protein
MADPVSPPRLIRFGVFEVDLRTGELRKHGRNTKLHGQPIDVLGMLLEHPGEMVTREELQKKLWPEDTFVDFDHSLNTAINKLREVLGDSADNPRFVETLHRRGYRFIYPVDSGAGSKSDPAVAAAPPSADVGAGLVPVPQPRERPQGAPLRVRWRLAVAAGAIVAAVAVLLALNVAGLRDRLFRNASPVAPSRTLLTRLTSDTGLTAFPAISADGKLVAYASDRSGEGNLDIWVQQVAGGEAIRLTRDPADDYEPAFSPDGSQIAFRSDRGDGGIYVVSAFGGEAKLFAREGRRPRYSPDGKWLAYWVGARHLVGDVYIMPAAGGEPRRVHSPGRSPVWSPDSKYLLFGGGRPPGTVVAGDWLVVPVGGGTDVKTGASKVLGQQGLRHGLGTFVPEAWIGDAVVFSARLGDAQNLWKVPISLETLRVAGPVVRLTSGTEQESQASFSADGRAVFSTLRGAHNIWLLPLDARSGKVTGELRQVTSQARQFLMPDLSVDGRILVYLEAKKENDVWVKDLETGQETGVLSTPQDQMFPRVTSDGSRVAYAVPGQDSGTRDIYVVPTRGGIPRKVCDNCGWYIAMSPSGERVAYTADDFVMQVEVNTGEKRQLLRRRRAFTGQSIEALTWESRYSPDGRWLAFMASDGIRHQVFIADLQTGSPEAEWVEATAPSGFDGPPAWSPDGNILYFISARDGFRCLWAQRLHPTTKRPEGAAFPVYHLHSTGRRLGPNPGPTGLAVARDKAVFAVEELSGNIWLMEHPE